MRGKGSLESNRKRGSEEQIDVGKSNLSDLVVSGSLALSLAGSFLPASKRARTGPTKVISPTPHVIYECGKRDVENGKNGIS